MYLVLEYKHVMIKHADIVGQFGKLGILGTNAGTAILLLQQS